MLTLHTRLIHRNWSVWLLLLILTNSILCAQTHLLLSAKLSEGWNQAFTFISHNIHPEHSRVSWRRALAERKRLWRRSYFTNRKNLFQEKSRVSKNRTNNKSTKEVMTPGKYANTAQNAEKSQVGEGSWLRTEPQKRKGFCFLQKKSPQLSRTTSLLLVLCNIIFV